MPSLFGRFAIGWKTHRVPPDYLLAYARQLSFPELPNPALLSAAVALRQLELWTFNAPTLASLLSHLPVGQLDRLTLANWTKHDPPASFEGKLVTVSRITISSLRLFTRPAVRPRHVLGQLNLSRLKWLQIVGRHSEDYADDFESIPPLRRLTLDLTRQAIAPVLAKIGLASVEWLDILACRDDNINDTLHALRKARRLHSLRLFIENGYELVPWSTAQLDKLISILQTLRNHSDGFTSVGDVSIFTAVPSLEQVIFAGRTSQAVRAAYRLEAGKAPVELPHDLNSWDLSDSHVSG